MSESPRPRSLYAELKRRNVFRVAIIYAGIFWFLLQVADVLFPALNLPDWTIRFVAALLILGFPLAIFFAWAYELTPEGLKRESSAVNGEAAAPPARRKLDFVIIVVLAAALGLFVLGKFVWRAQEDPSPAQAVAETAALSDPTIAVLPFENMSSDEEQDYFADGLTEELLNLFAKFPKLRVIGRTSSFQFKERSADLREIGRQLGADYLLEGSVRKSGNRLRISAQLVSAGDGVRVWSESFDQQIDDIFKVQEVISGAVADALKVRFFGEDLNVGSADARAYDLYLKGLRFSRIPGPENSQTALELLKQSLDIDPSLTPAWSTLASVHSGRTLRGLIEPAEGIRLANAAIDRALQLQPNSIDANTTLGHIRMNFDWDWAASEAAYRIALDADPNHPAALSGAGLLAASQGRLEEAKSLLRQSRTLDPLNLGSLHNLAFVHYLAGDDADAEAMFREAINFAGDSYPIGHTVLGLALFAQGRLEEALAEAQKTKLEQWRLSLESIIYHAMGNNAEAEAAFRILREQYGDRAAVPIAGSYAIRGDLDAAFEWLNRAYDQHDGQLTWTKVHPMHEPLRGDPRYDALLARLGLD